MWAALAFTFELSRPSVFAATGSIWAAASGYT
jgi:hypothetical protein